jgi:hypothetical protein
MERCGVALSSALEIENSHLQRRDQREKVVKTVLEERSMPLFVSLIVIQEDVQWVVICFHMTP